MQEEKRFFRTVCTLAIPAALQSLLQSSFSLVDQIMIGQLGAVSVAAVGLAGKFASIYAVVIAAIGAVAGIMISQYLGPGSRRNTGPRAQNSSSRRATARSGPRRWPY